MKPPDSVAHQRVLVQRAQTGDESAIADLLAIHEPFIRSRIRRAWSEPNLGEDLFSCAAMAFVAAVRKFDLARETDLRAFAKEYVDGEIRRELRGMVEVGWPAADRRARRSLVQVRRVLRGELGREPTATELAELVSVPLQRIDALANVKEQPLSDSVRTVDKVGDDLAEQEDTGSMIPEPAVHLADDEEDEVELFTQRYNRCLGILHGIERRIFELRYGRLLAGKRPLTLEHVAKEMGIRHVEDVRAIETVVLDRLEEHRLLPFAPPAEA
jgi:RNA polymerase sigma factor (sigma-70 family)